MVAPRKSIATLKGEEMRKQTLKAVTMLVSIIALAFMTAVAANAQSGSLKLRANVPFDFVVGDKTLPAGNYAIRQITQGSDTGLLVSSRDSRHKAVRLSNNVQANRIKGARITFRRYGSTYFLAQVWSSGSLEGREMLKSKAEREAARELAKNATSSDLAKAEVVTIFAEVE
jgi:hypothetical protein